MNNKYIIIKLRDVRKRVVNEQGLMRITSSCLKLHLPELNGLDCVGQAGGGLLIYAQGNNIKTNELSDYEKAMSKRGMEFKVTLSGLHDNWSIVTTDDEGFIIGDCVPLTTSVTERSIMFPATHSTGKNPNIAFKKIS